MSRHAGDIYRLRLQLHEEGHRLGASSAPGQRDLPPGEVGGGPALPQGGGEEGGEGGDFFDGPGQGEVRLEYRGQSTESRVKSTESRVQSKEHRVKSTE